MELPELKPKMNYDKAQIISADDLHWFANCLTLPIAAELARRSNLFPRLVAELEDVRKIVSSHVDEYHYKDDLAEIDRLLSEARQQERKGGDDGD